MKNHAAAGLCDSVFHDCEASWTKTFTVALLGELCKQDLPGLA